MVIEAGVRMVRGRTTSLNPGETSPPLLPSGEHLVALSVAWAMGTGAGSCRYHGDSAIFASIIAREISFREQDDLEDSHGRGKGSRTCACKCRGTDGGTVR